MTAAFEAARCWFESSRGNGGVAQWLERLRLLGVLLRTCMNHLGVNITRMPDKEGRWFESSLPRELAMRGLYDQHTLVGLLSVSWVAAIPGDCKSPV